MSPNKNLEPTVRFVELFDELLQSRQQEVLECLTRSESMRESIFQPNPSFMMERSMTNELMQTKDFMGTSGYHNFSMIYKNENSSVHNEFNDSAMFFDHLNTINFMGENDEPTRSKKLTKQSAEVNQSTYVTLEAQMNTRFKERFAPGVANWKDDGLGRLDPSVRYRPQADAGPNRDSPLR